MPRREWQMGVAALAGDCRASRGRWYLAFARRLLEGSPTVLGLLQADPFQGQPPRYLRSTLWDYRFTDPSERAATGNWWQREDLGPYCPILQLNGDRLAVAHLAR
jgi:hypothetical protein